MYLLLHTILIIYSSTLQTKLNPNKISFYTELQRNAPMFNDAVDYDDYDAKVFDYCKPKGRHAANATISSRTSVSTPHHSINHLTTMDHTSVHSSPEISKSFTGGITKKLSFQEDVSAHLLLRSVSEDQSRAVPVGSCDGKNYAIFLIDVLSFYLIKR